MLGIKHGQWGNFAEIDGEGIKELEKEHNIWIQRNLSTHTSCEIFVIS